VCHAEVPDGREPVGGVIRSDVVVSLGGDAQMPAVLALPATRSPEAGVLVIHDVYGTTPFYEELTTRLAAEGYAAMLPELFHRQGPLVERSREASRARRANFDELTALDDLQYGADALFENLTGPRRSLGSIGFCMGGTFAIDLLARRPGTPTVSFYGFPSMNDTPRLRAAPAPLDIVDQLDGPILGLWGDQDSLVGMDNVVAFDEALTSRSKDHEFTIYKGAGHGFMSASKFDPTHEAYEASVDAWDRTLSFLGAHLRS